MRGRKMRSKNSRSLSKTSTRRRIRSMRKNNKSRNLGRKYTKKHRSRTRSRSRTRTITRSRMSYRRRYNKRGGRSNRIRHNKKRRHSHRRSNKRKQRGGFIDYSPLTCFDTNNPSPTNASGQPEFKMGHTDWDSTKQVGHETCVEYGTDGAENNARAAGLGIEAPLKDMKMGDTVDTKGEEGTIYKFLRTKPTENATGDGKDIGSIISGHLPSTKGKGIDGIGENSWDDPKDFRKWYDNNFKVLGTSRKVKNDQGEMVTISEKDRLAEIELVNEASKELSLLAAPTRSTEQIQVVTQKAGHGQEVADDLTIKNLGQGIIDNYEGTYDKNVPSDMRAQWDSMKLYDDKVTNFKSLYDGKDPSVTVSSDYTRPVTEPVPTTTTV